MIIKLMFHVSASVACKIVSTKPNLELIWARSDPVNTCLMLQGAEEAVDEQIGRLLLCSCVVVLHKDDVKLTMGLRNTRKVLVFKYCFHPLFHLLPRFSSFCSTFTTAPGTRSEGSASTAPSCRVRFTSPRSWWPRRSAAWWTWWARSESSPWSLQWDPSWVF